MKLTLHLELITDATFGRGDGVAGLIDEEVEYDPATGLPFLRGRALKGLLVEECANILYALQATEAHARFEQAAQDLFGQPGSALDTAARLHVGPARVPPALCAAVEADVSADPPRLAPADVLESLTGIRRQTAVDEGTGAPDAGSLRSMRVVLRGTPLESELEFDGDPDPAALALLSACVLGLRRAGTARNRGRGRLEASLRDAQGGEVTGRHFDRFRELAGGGAA